MRRSKLLLLLAWEGSLAALTMQDDLPRAQRPLPAGPALEAAHAPRRRLSDSGICDYAILSGSSNAGWTHGTYEESLCDDGTPLYTCIDCSSQAYIWYKVRYWYVGDGGCGSSYLTMYLEDPDEDLAMASGTWQEWTGSFTANSDIAVACYAAAGCQLVPGTTAKYRCFDCADASGSRVGPSRRTQNETK